MDGVDPKSTVETYVACKLSADTWRWAGVPIVIRAGKTMPVTATEVTITFKDPPHDVFGIEPEHPADMLTFRIWPETAVSMTLQGKKPAPAGSAPPPGAAATWSSTAAATPGHPAHPAQLAPAAP